jgi:predicted HTH transcriptional regulator
MIDGKQVLEVKIPVSAHAPHRAPNTKGEPRVFVRVKDQNLLANGVLMKVWKKRQSGKDIHFVYSAEVQKLLKHLKGHRRVSLAETRQITRFSKFKAEQLLSDLILLDILEMKITETESFYILKDLPES